MNILDYVILAIFALGTVIGIFKGFLKQILTVVGVIVVATLTATVQPYVQSWLTKAIASENTRSVVSLIATVILLIVAYSLFALLIRRILRGVSILKLADRILGGLIGFAVVYFVFAVIVALFLQTSETFMPTIKGWLNDDFQGSWIVTKIYGKNFFGDWIIKDIAEKLINRLRPAA